MFDNQLPADERLCTVQTPVTIDEPHGTIAAAHYYRHDVVLPTGALAGRTVRLSVEPLVIAGRGIHPRSYVASVDIDVPDYDTWLNVFRVVDSRDDVLTAFNRAVDKGVAALSDAIDRFTS